MPARARKAGMSELVHRAIRPFGSRPRLLEMQGVAKVWWQWLLLGGGVVATVAVVWVVGRRARQLLDEQLED